MRSGKGLWAVLASVPLAVALVGVARGEGDEKPKFLGVEACAKLCHKSEPQGNQLGIWEQSKHAEAYKRLLTPEAKEAGKKVGVDAPEKSDKCLKCHASGFGVPKELLDEGFTIEHGVQCETCHGAGEFYKKKTVMKDRKKAAELGMVLGDEKTCLQCHNDTAPTWKADRYTTKDGKKVGFDYAQMWPKIAHPLPKEKKEE